MVHDGDAVAQRLALVHEVRAEAAGSNTSGESKRESSRNQLGKGKAVTLNDYSHNDPAVAVLANDVPGEPAGRQRKTRQALR